MATLREELLTAIAEEQNNVSYQNLKNVFEKIAIKNILEQAHFNQSTAALALDMSRGTFRAKLKQHFGNKYLRNTK